MNVDPRFPKSWPGPIERLAERANPILVKEVRQALRGQYFRLVFWLTLSAATVIGMMVLMAASATNEPQGISFFSTIFGCLAIAAHGFVPFAAFVAMGSEWEENTYDLLVLSNLKPRQIVIGKLLAAGTQALLIYSAFGPFLVFAFLLGGVDLLAILVVLAASMLLSLGLSAVAIALSTSTQSKYLRIVAMAVLAAFLMWVTFVSMFMGTALVSNPGELSDPQFRIGLIAMFTLGLVFLSLPLAQACSRLAHPEENRSTPLRSLTYLLLVCGLGWATYLVSRMPDRDATIGISIFSIICLGVGCMSFLTEPERFGRRARLGIPRSRFIAFVTLPVQPGATRALLWFLCGGVFVWLWYIAVNAIWPDGHGTHGGHLLAPLVPVLYGFVYLGLPGLLVHERIDSSRTRITVRLLAPAIAVSGVLGPAILGFFLDNSRLSEFAHAGNPVWVVLKLWEDEVGGVKGSLFLVTTVAAIVLALNAVRIGRAVRETRQASAEARARAAALPSKSRARELVAS